MAANNRRYPAVLSVRPKHRRAGCPDDKRYTNKFSKLIVPIGLKESGVGEVNRSVLM